MNLKIIGQLFIVVVLILSAACNNSSMCLSDQSAIQAGLYSGSSGKDKDTTLTHFFMWGLNNPGDSVLLTNVNASKLYMPSNINRDSTEFIIRQERLVSGEVKGVNDTLLFIYSRQLEYVSGDCGFTYNLELDTILHTFHLIDSVRISYSSVIYNENIENVKIYIEP